MKIKKVKWNNHPVLGNLELDFADSNGQPYQNIMLAGENGTGKTIILKSINSFLNGHPLGEIEYLEYDISGQMYKASKIIQVEGQYLPQGSGNYSLQKPDGTHEFIVEHNNPLGTSTATKPIDARFCGSVFSKARADYKTDIINSTTSQLLDIKNRDSDDEENFSPLKQLLVDISSQDNEEYTLMNKGQGNVAVSYDHVFYPNSKLFRFKNAFDSFFDNITYHGVVTDVGVKKIIFKKFGRDISIDDLSTGEKQIVFRGVYLLRNSGKLIDANIFVDEPELSMHPKWQQKILRYYTQLFSSGGVQTAQMFFATHSEHVLKAALSNKTDNIVVVLKESGGVIAAHKIDAPSVLPSITNAETNYLAFDIVSNDYHIELYGYLQDKLSKNVKQTDTYIEAQTVFYNTSIHEKIYIKTPTTYNTLPTYIRNCIHHPDATRSFTEDELRISIELLIRIISAIP